MKKFLIILAALSALFCSCNKEATTTEPSKCKVTILPTIESEPLTRSAMSDLVPYETLDEIEFILTSDNGSVTTSNHVAYLDEGTYTITVKGRGQYTSNSSCSYSKVPLRYLGTSFSVKQGETKNLTIVLSYIPVAVLFIPKSEAKSVSGTGSFSQLDEYFYLIVNPALTNWYTYSQSYTCTGKDGYFDTIFNLRGSTSTGTTTFSGSTYTVSFATKVNTIYTLHLVPKTQVNVTDLSVDYPTWSESVIN